MITVAHPDHGGTAEEAQLVNQAKEILLNPTRKSDYNKALLRHKLTDGFYINPDFEMKIQRRKERRGQ